MLIPFIAGFFLVTVFLIAWWALLFYTQRSVSMGKSSRCLLVIAHPDDEVMFFGPILRRLQSSGATVYIISLTSGNADGLGKIRRREIFQAVQALGISPNNVLVKDHTCCQDGFDQKWDFETVCRIILYQIEHLDIEVVISFDGYGISGHPNHISCFSALQFLYTNGLLPTDVQVFCLETVSLLRKYSGLLDLFLGSITSTFLYVASPHDVIAIYKSMSKYKSQLVWFRYLYMVFSRYVFINSLKRIHMHRYISATPSATSNLLKKVK